MFWVEHQLWDHHRGAWGAAMRAIGLGHDPRGPYLLGSVEDQLLMGNVRPPRPWAGFVHTTSIGIPEWSLGWLTKHENWLACKHNCIGLFVMCQASRKYLLERVSCRVERLLMPISPVASRWKLSRWRANPDKKLLLVGTCLRDFDAVDRMPPTEVPICLLQGGHSAYYQGVEFKKPVRRIPRAANLEYDDLLSENLVFLPLKEAAAVNAVNDCLATNTPVLTNRLSGTEEYLGKDYPLYYETEQEAADLVADERNIIRAHDYLAAMDKSHLSLGAFLSDFAGSEIYKTATQWVESR